MRTAEVLRLVSGALQDLEPGQERRWQWAGGDTESVGLLDLLNAAALAVALHRPDATAKTRLLRLTPGARQNLPPDAETLIELIRNMGDDGHTPGAAIQIMHVDLLTAMAAYTQAGNEVRQYAYDRLTNSLIFWVLPAVQYDADVWVEATLSLSPRPVTSPDDPLPVPDAYAQALVHHMLASILSGDNEASNVAKAQLHTQMWSSLMGLKQNIDGQWPKSRSAQ